MSSAVAEYLEAVLCQLIAIKDALDADYNDAELRARQIEVESKGGRPPAGRTTRLVKEIAEKPDQLLRAAMREVGLNPLAVERLDAMKRAHQNLMNAANLDYENRVDPLAPHGESTRVWFGEHAAAAMALQDLLPAIPMGSNQHGAASKQSKSPPLSKADATAMLHAIGDDTAAKVMAIAEKTDLDTEEKLIAISQLDDRYYAWNSPKLGQLIKVSAGMIRQTNWWIIKRKTWLEDNAVNYR